MLRLKLLVLGPVADAVGAGADPAVLAALRRRAALSLGSSVVLNSLHVTMEKWQRRIPTSAVSRSNELSVCSVCSRSLA